MVLFAFKAKKPEPLPEYEIDPVQSQKKKPKTKQKDPVLDQFTAGKKGEEMIVELKKFDFPAKGVAPMVPVVVFDADGKKTTDRERLYEALADEMELVADIEMIVDLAIYLGQKQNKSAREKILLKAAKIVMKK